MAKELTIKEEGFAKDFVLCGDATEAYRNNYNAENMKPETVHSKACLLKAKGKVAARIKELQEKVKKVAEEQFEIDAAWVLKRAYEINERCMQHEPVIVGGEPTGEYKFDAAGANKSLELIGKHVSVQAFLDKSQTKVSGNVSTVQFTPEEYAQAEQRLKDMGLD